MTSTLAQVIRAVAIAMMEDEADDDVEEVIVMPSGSFEDPSSYDDELEVPVEEGSGAGDDVDPLVAPDTTPPEYDPASEPQRDVGSGGSDTTPPEYDPASEPHRPD